MTGWRWRVEILVALLAGAACDGSTHTAGHVRDEAGAPVADAVVVLTRGGRRAVVRTDSAGAYEVTQLHGTGHAPVEVRFCKAGFRTEARAFARDDSVARPLDVTLRRSQPDTVARVRGPGPCA